MSTIRKQAIKGVRLGQIFSVSRKFTAKDVAQFADISRDYNPVHCDERFTKVKSFDGPVCHGLLIASMLTEIGGQLGWLASGMNLQFKKPVYLNQTITCYFKITDLLESGHSKAKVIFTNENEDVVLEAVLKGILPGPEEKQVLQAMVKEGDPTNKVDY